MPSVFSKIYAGELPCHEIYRDGEVFAFLDIRPIAPGHALVVSVQEIDNILDVPEELYLNVMSRARHLARGIAAATGAARVGVIVEGFQVPHFHVHLVPVNSAGGMSFSKAAPAGEEELSRMRQKILAALG